MPKINIGPNAFTYPMPVVLVGTQVAGKINFMTVGWVSRMNFKPPLIGVCINQNHHTPKGILENKTFSINIPSADMAEITDYCGLVSGKKNDKSQLFDIFYGEIDTAPMIKNCPVTMECRLFKTIDLPESYLFIAEIIEAYADEKCLSDGLPDVKKINPLTLTMPDNSYWTVGEPVGRAWGIGKKLN